jgi:hypothetical protein
MTSSAHKNLAQIGISISASHCPPASGYRNDNPTTNDLTLNLSRCLISHGYATAFGHDWRPEGVMMALYEFAEAHDVNVGPCTPQHPLIYNYRYHGMKSELESWEIKKLEGVVNLVECPEPEVNEKNSSLYGLARSLSKMRSYMTQQLSARVCLGGKDPADFGQMSKGRLPGVLEEILFSLAAKQPLYLSSLFGGVTEWVVKILLGDQPEPLNFILSEDLQRSYFQQSSSVSAKDFQELTDESIALDIYLLQETLKETGFKKICQHNGLTEKQNMQLMCSQTLEEFTHWVLIGLKNMNP